MRLNCSKAEHDFRCVIHLNHGVMSRMDVDVCQQGALWPHTATKGADMDWWAGMK